MVPGAILIAYMFDIRSVTPDILFPLSLRAIIVVSFLKQTVAPSVDNASRQGICSTRRGVVDAKAVLLLGLSPEPRRAGGTLQL